MKLLRKFLAFSLLALIGVGLFGAIVGFSGFDPTKIDLEKMSAMLTNRGKKVLAQAISKERQATADAPKQATPKQKLLVVGLVSDSHNDNANLEKALTQAKALGVEQVIGLGDYTSVGTVKELTAAKKIADASGLAFAAVPGDHDLWDNKNKGELATKNFEQVFGPPYQVISLHGVTLLLVHNSNNDTGLSPTEFTWLKLHLQEAASQQACSKTNSKNCGQPIFIVTHEPLYHPTTGHVMGRLAPAVEEQRKQMIQLFKDNSVAEVLAGDIHFFSRYVEPISQLPMTTIGALTDARNPQKPRFAVLTIYSDNSYSIDDIEVQ